MKKLFLILAIVFTFTCEAQRTKTFPSPKVEVIDTMTNNEWLEFYRSQPVIYVRLYTKQDLFPHEYRKTWRYCYLSWYRATIIDENTNVVCKYTHRLRKDEIVRP